MAELSQIELNGTTYDIKDAVARAAIAEGSGSSAVEVSSENLLFDPSVTPIADTPTRIATYDIARYSNISNYKLTSTGIRTSASSSYIDYYRVIAGTTIYLKLTGNHDVTYQFHRSSGYPPTSGTNSYLIGSPVSGDIDGFVEVPSGAYYIFISRSSTNTTNVIKYANINQYANDAVSSVTLANADSYEIKDSLARQSVLFGYVDSSASTSSNLVAIVPGLTELRHGTECYIQNTRAPSNSFSLNINNLGDKPVYNYIFSSTSGSYFPANRTIHLIYNEWENSWYSDYIATTGSIGSYSNIVPTSGAVYSYINNHCVGKEGTLYIYRENGVNYPGSESYQYTPGYASGYYVISDNRENPVVALPQRLFLEYTDTYDENDYHTYTYRSTVFPQGYYEFIYTYDDQSGYYDCIWYLRPSIDTSLLEEKSNKVTTLSASSTDTQYPSAKCVYDIIGDVESALYALR